MQFSGAPHISSKIPAQESPIFACFLMLAYSDQVSDPRNDFLKSILSTLKLLHLPLLTPSYSATKKKKKKTIKSPFILLNSTTPLHHIDILAPKASLQSTQKTIECSKKKTCQNILW